MENSLNSKASPFFWQQLDNKYELLLEIANDDTKPLDEWDFFCIKQCLLLTNLLVKKKHRDKFKRMF